MADGEATREKIRAAIRAGAPTFQAVGDALGIRMQTVHAHLKRMDDAEQLRAIMAGNKKPRRITAFGETKTAYAWAKDPRCAVSINTLNARLAKGWTVKAALTTPPQRRGRNKTLTGRETAALKAAADLVRSLPKVHRHMPDDAPSRVATRERDRLLREAAGHATIAEVARAAGLSYERAHWYIRGGRQGARRATCAPLG